MLKKRKKTLIITYVLCPFCLRLLFPPSSRTLPPLSECFSGDLFCSFINSKQLVYPICQVLHNYLSDDGANGFSKEPRGGEDRRSHKYSAHLFPQLFHPRKWGRPVLIGFPPAVIRWCAHSFPFSSDLWFKYRHSHPVHTAVFEVA